MRLKELRKEKGLNQIKLAEIFNVKQNTISQWESGEREPDNETLKALAKFFGVTTDYLLNGEKGQKYVNDDETLEILDQMHKRPEMKALFQVTRRATKEDVEGAVAFVEVLKKKRGDD